MDLPHELSRRLTGWSLEPISIGESGATVWRCTQPDQSPLYLKAAPLAAYLRLDREAACMRWLRNHGAPVPATREYVRTHNSEYLLAEEATGVPASAPKWNADQRCVAIALGDGLAALHAIDARRCPFDRGINRQLEEARLHIASGRVRESDFDGSRLGRDAADLFAELLAMVPSSEDLVLVHGDFCLPNVLVDKRASGEFHVSGLVDCGRAGIGDRHQDLALAIRSLTSNFGPDVVAPFLEAYRCSPLDAARLEFFTVLDEFF